MAATGIPGLTSKSNGFRLRFFFYLPTIHHIVLWSFRSYTWSASRFIRFCRTINLIVNGNRGNNSMRRCHSHLNYLTQCRLNSIAIKSHTSHHRATQWNRLMCYFYIYDDHHDDDDDDDVNHRRKCVVFTSPYVAVCITYTQFIWMHFVIANYAIIDRLWLQQKTKPDDFSLLKFLNVQSFK